MKLEKTTRRRYDDACGAAHAMELLGERWALLVVRELLWSPKRFGELRTGLPAISANVLSQRLGELEAAGVVCRRTLPPPANVAVYDLTEWGREAEPIFQALGRWAARSPAHDPTLPISAASVLGSLRTMLDPARAEGVAMVVGLEMGAERYRLTLSGGELRVALGAAEDADVVMAGLPKLIAATIYGGQPVETVLAKGSTAAARRFVDLFLLPERAEA
ncbi:MAG: helix-turn-helix transcriptional regulator [Pseudomonadota bacterium]|nr:helix-turn-helix transcriptional regulator [Pseudomonadota bacterium]